MTASRLTLMLLAVACLWGCAGESDPAGNLSPVPETTWRSLSGEDEAAMQAALADVARLVTTTGVRQWRYSAQPYPDDLALHVDGHQVVLGAPLFRRWRDAALGSESPAPVEVCLALNELLAGVMASSADIHSDLMYHQAVVGRLIFLKEAEGLSGDDVQRATIRGQVVALESLRNSRHEGDVP